MSEEVDKLKELGIVSPQQSIAKAIDHLSSRDRIKMMSVISKRKEVSQIEAMYSVGEELGYKWLKDCADNRLQLWVSCEKGRGRKDIVDVVKQPSEKMGIAGQLKDKIASFIKSEG